MTARPPAGFNPAANVRVADRLLSDGRITPEMYEAAVAHLKRMGGRIEESLLEVQALTEADLLKHLAAIHKTRFVSTERLAKADIDRLTLDKVPKKVAERYTIVPVLFDAEKSVLSIVTADPDNVEVLDQVQKAAGVRQVAAFVGRPAAVKAAVNKLYLGDIHAFAILDRKAQEEFTSMLNVYERNLMSEESMSMALVDAKVRERTLSSTELEKPGASAAAAASGGGATSDNYAETVNVLISLLENARPDLRGHSAQVARLTRKIGERIGLAKTELNSAIVAAYLHDLGKMGTYHLTALNVSEYDGHRVAAQKAYLMPHRLMETVHLAPSTTGAMESMYERYDGNGFPGQASGKDIPLGARLLAITDTYADLTQNPRNPFRKTLRPVEACDVLAKYKGTIFDPNLVDLFRATVSGEDIRARILSNRQLALLVDADPEETTVLELRMIEQGFEVRIARTTDQAMKLLETGEIEIVVSELDLLPQDGFALLSEARKHPWGRDLPWLILTRRQARAEAQRAFELGVLDFVLKPAPTEVLVQKLKQELSKRATTKQARGVSGSLSEMGLPDLVQILWHGRKSGALRLRHGNEAGEIHFTDGQVVNAMWGRHRGEEAFFAMLHLQEGEFGLDPNFKPPAVVINASPEALLLEGMRRMDEGQRPM